MKIALVTRRYPPLIGGAEKVLSYLADAFAAQGVEVSVLTSRIDPAWPAVEHPRPNLSVVRLETSPLRFVGTWLYLRNLRRWFTANPVDLAYVSMLKHDAFAVVNQGRKQGFPVVLRPEGAGATGDIAWQKWGRFGASIARVCRTADAFVSISQAVRSELLLDGYDPSKIVNLPNGVPLPNLAWTPKENPRHVATFVGRLAPEKGLDSLIDAWTIVVRNVPHARLVLVGDGPSRFNLESKVSALGLEKQVEFAGSSTDPSQFLQQSDLFVLPSKEEGMSIALLEAMALGMPVVASDIPGNRRLIENDAFGRLFPVGDPESLAKTILETWADPERAQLLGEAARRRVEEHYSIEAVARRHLDLFDALIRSKAESPGPWSNTRQPSSDLR